MEDSFERDRKARQKRFLDKFWEDSPHALDLLKGHLLIEEVLEEVIASACRLPATMYEAKMNFFNKVKLAQAICGEAIPAWRCAEKLNVTRNELAHGRNDSVLLEKIDSFIAVTRQGYSDGTWGDDRQHNLEIAVIVVHAALSRVAADRMRA
jgi:hypothetical protein